MYNCLSVTLRIIFKKRWQLLCNHCEVGTFAVPFNSSFTFINLSPVEDLIPGKTGVFDEAIVLDTDLSWIVPFYECLTNGRDPEALLWPVTVSEILGSLDSAITCLQLSSLNICRYALRHGGASEDLITRARTPLEVKRRGTWRSDASLKRYGKEAKLLGELKKVSPDVLDFGNAVRGVLGPLFLGNVTLPPPAMAMPGLLSKKKKAPVRKRPAKAT